MDGLNTRFDIYANGFQSCKDNYVADVNVRKGYVTLGNVNWCNAKPSGTNWPIADALAAALPVDQNMIFANADNGAQQAGYDHRAREWDLGLRRLLECGAFCGTGRESSSAGLHRAPPRSVDIASTNTR